MQGFNEDKRGSAERVVSAGGVIFRSISGEVEVALVSRGNVWCLPKGLIEEGETAEETAVREVKEETGLDGKLIERIGEINYGFSGGKKRFFKKVHFYLLENIGGSLEAHDSEMDKVKWFPILDAVRVLTYINERNILEKASKMLLEKRNL